MKRKFRVTMGTQIVVMVLTMSVVLCATALFVNYYAYKNRMMGIYEEMGENLSRTLLSRVEPEELDRYYETLERDDRYYDIQRFLIDLAENNDVEYLYVVRPNGTGVTFLFDSDMELGENMDYQSGGYCALGTYVELVGGFVENLDKLLAGEPVEPIVQEDPSYGWLMTTVTPVLHDNGSMAGYVMVDISMGAVMREMRDFLLSCGGLLAAITLVFVGAYLLLARRSIILPVRQLTGVAESYTGGKDDLAMKRLQIKGSRELRTLADAFRFMLAEIRVNSLEQQELALQEQRLANEVGLARELNQAMLPKGLPERKEPYPFQVRGLTRQGGGTAGCFYDYFMLDRDRLCVLIGETPGSGVAQALYTVMGKTTIKSHLVSGLSLTETMSAANRQLYEMGSELYLNVLVGVLDGATGHFSCINAGQRDPLVMRSGNQYKWLDAFSFAPLGQNENVLYRGLELDLSQGDRLLLRTEGLDAIQGQDGRAFSDGRLRIVLNEKKVREAELAAQLRSVSEAGADYGTGSGKIRGYALLALEYLRRDAAQAHCVVTPDAAGAAELEGFLRGQLQANRIAGRWAAQMLVLGDEVFALCRRGAEPDQRFLAECSVSWEEQTMVLRLNGSLNGRNPLDGDDEGTRHAVDFIRENCEYVSFEHGASKDTVILVRRLAQEAGRERIPIEV